MAKGSATTKLISFVAWVTGVLVSLAVGFGLIDEILTVPYVLPVITVTAGWIVVILTIVGAILAIANRA